MLVSVLPPASLCTVVCLLPAETERAFGSPEMRVTDSCELSVEYQP